MEGYESLLKTINQSMVEDNVEQEIALNDRYELWHKNYEDLCAPMDFIEEENSWWQTSIYDIEMGEEVAVILWGKGETDFIVESLI